MSKKEEGKYLVCIMKTLDWALCNTIEEVEGVLHPYGGDEIKELVSVFQATPEGIIYRSEPTISLTLRPVITDETDPIFVRTVLDDWIEDGN